MTPARLRRTLSLALILFSFNVLEASGGKHRSVRHPDPIGPKLTGTISGTVLDAVTNAPVVNMHVLVGVKSDITDKDGKFEVKNAVGYGFIPVEAERTGYAKKIEHLTQNGDQQITLRVDPTPTVRVRKIDSSTLDVDFESLEFGYPVPFSGYRQAVFEDFCKGGASVQIDRTEIRKITGPATPVTDSQCCPGTEVLRINIELKSGEKTDVYFNDSCAGYIKIDLIGRDHVGGKTQYIPFTQISEIVFP